LARLETVYLAATDNQTKLNRELAEQKVTADAEQAAILRNSQEQVNGLRTEINAVIKKANPDIDDDHDYIFMHFVMNYLPIGLVGLLFAVIFSASMSSTSSALNGLATTFSVDIYKRFINKNASEQQHLNASKVLTVLFGAMAIGFALVCSMFDNLIEAVNILGSLFYGTILGIFLTAFLLKRVKGNAVFYCCITFRGYNIVFRF
jgi:Na+/proline symporter